jgi:hypothetical protein
MFPTVRWRILPLAALVVVAFSQLAGAGPAPLTLETMTRKAGLIFAGQVVGIDRVRNAPGNAGTVRVSFRVERAIRGVHVGQIFTINQWAVLWENGSERYRIGQRLMLFFYPRSRAGLTSAIGGRLGQFEMDHTGNLVLRADQIAMFAGQPLQKPIDGKDPDGLSRSPLPGHRAMLGYGDFVRAVRQAAPR